jgi:hypothetical protein
MEELSPPEKNLNDEFMLKEYESIAAAHFDSQDGLRQQFRFYLLVVAVPLTVLGLAWNRQPGGPVQTKDMNLLSLPTLVSWVFVGIGFLGFLLSLAMIHTAFDSVLYARTVNGLRKYFYDRAFCSGVDLEPYLVMPLNRRKPRYFHFRSFFYQHLLISLVNAAYMWVGIANLSRLGVALWVCVPVCFINITLYKLFAIVREWKQIAD